MRIIVKYIYKHLKYYINTVMIYLYRYIVFRNVNLIFKYLKIVGKALVNKYVCYKYEDCECMKRILKPLRTVKIGGGGDF